MGYQTGKHSVVSLLGRGVDRFFLFESLLLPALSRGRPRCVRVRSARLVKDSCRALSTTVNGYDGVLIFIKKTLKFGRRTRNYWDDVFAS